MTKDSRFKLLLPITITDAERQEILERISNLDRPIVGAYLDPDSLTPISDVDPKITESHLELFRAWNAEESPLNLFGIGT